MWLRGVAFPVVLSIAACSPRPMSQVPARPPTCTIVYNDRSLAECKHLAVIKNDGNAAMAIARYYDRPGGRAKELARNGSCYAQARLAKAYTEGDLVSPDALRAYFWSLLAEVNRFERTFPAHSLLGDGFFDSNPLCARVTIRLIPGKIQARVPNE